MLTPHMISDPLYLISITEVKELPWLPFHQGSYTYADGSVYKGQWDNDKIHGTGKSLFQQCIDWKPNDRLRSTHSIFQTNSYTSRFLSFYQGTSIFANGNRYEGEWENGKINGKPRTTIYVRFKYLWAHLFLVILLQITCKVVINALLMTRAKGWFCN